MNTWLVASGSLKHCGAAAAMRAASRLALLGIALPHTTFEVREKLHGGVSSLAEQLPRPLATELEVRDAGRIEKHHGLRVHAAILDHAKRQHVDARLPGEVGRVHFLGHQRVGEACAVHVHGHVVFVSNLRERA